MIQILLLLVHQTYLLTDRMKIIFLDIDGVLNSDRSIMTAGKKHQAWKSATPDTGGYEKFTVCTIDPIAVELINLLVRETGAKIVLSSVHRNHFKGNEDVRVPLIREYLGKLGIESEHVIGFTSSNFNGHRGSQINEWLEKNPQVLHYVIIDDSSDMLDCQKEHFVLVSGRDGLSSGNYRDASRILDFKLSDIIQVY